MFTTLLRVFSRCVRNWHGLIIAFVVLDLDNLKQINDQFGHASGDTVLIEFSRILLDVVKKNRISRLGGDQCVVFFTQASLVDA
jgi:diguanylate cyclase (GGDEF)-like protein